MKKIIVVTVRTFPI